jgi:hypothetical protein
MVENDQYFSANNDQSPPVDCLIVSPNEGDFSKGLSMSRRFVLSVFSRSKRTSADCGSKVFHEKLLPPRSQKCLFFQGVAHFFLQGISCVVGKTLRRFVVLTGKVPFAGIGGFGILRGPILPGESP